MNSWTVLVEGAQEFNETGVQLVEFSTSQDAPPGETQIVLDFQENPDGIHAVPVTGESIHGIPVTPFSMETESEAVHGRLGLYFQGNERTAFNYQTCVFGVILSGIFFWQRVDNSHIFLIV